MIVPAAFNHRLATTFGSDYRMTWDATVGRFALHSLSAAGKPITQYWCWFYDPVTREPLAPDPATGLHPYRGLDQRAQDEIVRNLQVSYIGQTGDGLTDWTRDQQARRAHNTALQQQRVRARAQQFADLIHEVKLNRPWLKHHSGSATSRRIAREHTP